MRMYCVRTNLLDTSRTGDHQSNEKEGREKPFPARAIQVGENAPILHQGFKRLRCVSKPMD